MFVGLGKLHTESKDRKEISECAMSQPGQINVEETSVCRTKENKPVPQVTSQ